MRWILAVLTIISLWHCKPEKPFDEDTGTLSIQFFPKYGNLTFQPLQSYTYGSKQSIKWSALDFYITGIQLLSSGGNVAIDQVGLVDLASSDVSTKRLDLINVKAGNYSGIRFQLGVKSDLNKKLPKDFKSTNPLSSTGHHWDAWNSYIFARMEGVLDTAGKGVFELPFAIHTGTDACIQTVEIQKIFDIPVTSEYILPVEIDLQNVYSQSGVYFDIANSPLNHNPSNIEVLKLFSSRLAQAIQLKK